MAVQIDARVQIDGVNHEGCCRNLSLGGMSLECTASPKVGSKVRVWLRFGGKRELFVAGTVQWSTPDLVGIQHDLLGAQATYVLSEMVARAKERFSLGDVVALAD